MILQRFTLLGLGLGFILGLNSFASPMPSPTPSPTPNFPELRPDIERLLHHPGANLNAIDLDQKGLSKATTPVQPWSSSYWPDAVGGIAVRYQLNYKKGSIFGPAVGNLVNFNRNKAAYADQDEKMKEKVRSLSEDDLARELSPAEKYDWLMGDPNFSLTNGIINEISFRVDHKMDWKTGHWTEQGGLSPWVGICDGWTVAALHLPRPVKTVKVVGASGQVMTFYPDDLKALASHLFARTNQWLGIERMGNRCDTNNSHVDEYGRPIADSCHDINAGLWHATVMNRIGLDHRGFVIDVSNDPKVNNHPVFSYEASYFNPTTGVYDSLQKSIVPIASVDDGVKDIRNPKATHLVGVEMDVTMLDYDWPSGEDADGPDYDKLKYITYVYDLELDAKGEIVGGQWHDQGRKFLFFGKVSEVQPDMLWMLAPNQLAWSRNSAQADEGPAIDPKKMEIWGNIDWKFKGDGRIPADWYAVHLDSARFKLPSPQPYSTITSAHPLAEMVYYLFDQAK